MKEKILDILEKHYHGRNHIESRCADELLGLFGVSGMVSSDKLEQAYKDGVKDALAKGYGTFNEENYR